MAGTGLALVLAGAGALIALVARGDILGLSPEEAVGLLAGLSGALYATGWAAAQARGGWRPALAGILVWILLLFVCSLVYVDRDAILSAARITSDRFGLGPPSAEVGPGGSITVRRRIDGTFVVPMRIGGREIPFIFDTGASTLVLTTETARLAGFKPDALRFAIPVTTANGRAHAARVTLDQVSIGPITIHRVEALVVAPGLLEGNLLGMTLLDRLASYEVRGSRLVLRAGKG